MFTWDRPGPGRRKIRIAPIPSVYARPSPCHYVLILAAGTQRQGPKGGASGALGGWVPWGVRVVGVDVSTAMGGWCGGSVGG